VSIILHFFIAFIVGMVLLVAGQFFFNGILNIPPERIFAARMVFYFMIISTMFTIMTVPYDAVLNAHENMLYFAIVGIIEAILKLAVALMVVYTLSDKLIIYGLLMAAISLIVMVLMRLYCHKKYEECVFNPKSYFDKSLMKKMTGFSGWNLLGTSSSMIANYGQGIVVNMFFGTVVNAAQAVAGQISGQLGVFAATMLKSLYPVIAKSEGAGNRSLMVDATMMGSKISFFLLAFFTIPAFIEMPYLLDVWLKNVPEFAVIFCRLLLIKCLIEYLFYPISYSIAAHGNIKKYEIISSIICCCPLVVSFILFKAGYPPYFLYVSFIIYAICAAGIILYFAWNNYGFPVVNFLKSTVLRCISIFAIVFTVSYVPFLIIHYGLFRLLAVITLSMTAFLVLAWFIGFSKSEKTQIIRLISPFLSKILSKLRRNH
jgi:O-antigen/teichoic acid export membrane protein